MPYRQRITEFIKQNEEELYTLLQKLCAIPAPSLFEDERAEFCRAYLHGIGAQGAYTDEAKNTIFLLDGEEELPLTVLAAHTDTVFPDRTPMPYTDDGVRIHCPGVGDNTASVAALLLTVKFFITEGIRPRGGILFVFNAAEEGLGNLLGVRRIFEDFDGRIGQFISLDSFSFSVANDTCVGSVRYEVTVRTEGGHSFVNFGNENAIHRLAELVTRIYALDVLAKEGAHTTYNVGCIEGGTSVNTIAEEAHMLCECRSDDAECLALMQAALEEIFAASRHTGVDISYRLVGLRPCASPALDTAEMERMKKKAAALLCEVTGVELSFRPGSTDCNIPLSLAIPALCIPVYTGGGAHTRGEWVEKASLPTGLAVAICAALAFSDQSSK